MDPTPSAALGPLQRAAEEAEAAIRGVATRQAAGLPVLETLLLRLIVLLGREVSAQLEMVLGPHGLNEADYRALLTLQSRPGGLAHPGELCASVARSAANLTRIADGLHARGLISRVPSDTDRRRTILRITPAGEALLAELVPQVAQRVAEMFADVPGEARGQLQALLRALIVGVDRCSQRSAAASPAAAPMLRSSP